MSMGNRIICTECTDESCKKCRRRASDRKHYRNNPERQRKVKQANNVAKLRKRVLKRLYLWMHYDTCVSCKVQKDWIHLEFDHVVGPKVANISDMLGGSYSVQSFIDEMDKCDILCSECHREKTFIQQQQYGCHSNKNVLTFKGEYSRDLLMEMATESVAKTVAVVPHLRD